MQNVLLYEIVKNFMHKLLLMYKNIEITGKNRYCLQ